MWRLFPRRKPPPGEEEDAAPHCPDCGQEMLWTESGRRFRHRGYWYCENCPAPGKYAEDHNLCPTCYRETNKDCDDRWHGV